MWKRSGIFSTFSDTPDLEDNLMDEMLHQKLSEEI
jgi:hypothetical protein